MTHSVSGFGTYQLVKLLYQFDTRSILGTLRYTYKVTDLPEIYAPHILYFDFELRNIPVDQDVTPKEIIKMALNHPESLRPGHAPNLKQGFSYVYPAPSAIT